jgi:hypothetical protein
VLLILRSSGAAAEQRNINSPQRSSAPTTNKLRSSVTLKSITCRIHYNLALLRSSLIVVDHPRLLILRSSGARVIVVDHPVLLILRSSGAAAEQRNINSPQRSSAPTTNKLRSSVTLKSITCRIHYNLALLRSSKT